MKIEPEFKEAILNLPTKEKDKLLIRLLKHDQTLLDKLHFELIDTESVESKREKINQNILYKIEWLCGRFKSPGGLLMPMRYLSGDITYHCKITKDKFGEVYLNLNMINCALEKGNEKLNTFHPATIYKLNIYFINKFYKILTLIQKMHEDYLLDFENDLMKLGELISQNKILMQMATQREINLDWFRNADIPEDIENLAKDLRKKGQLK